MTLLSGSFIGHHRIPQSFTKSQFFITVAIHGLVLTRHKDDFVYAIVNDALCNGIKSTGIK